jgi:hypothetical protein
MPINRLLDNAAFDPAAITALRDAYARAQLYNWLIGQTLSPKSLQRRSSSTLDAVSVIHSGCARLS